MEKGTTMAKASDYDIVTFQRKPGRWRANVTPIVQIATRRQGLTILGFVTTEDSSSEESAAIAADKAIKALDDS
ncbi:hypothetical protein [Bradyrhizobium lablabi]|nr:hypothetical protein [Bradyrhizobium lablabi]